MAKENIFTIGGTVQAGSGLYIPREVDDELLQLCRSQTFAFVLTARQMGKSSLMIRTAERLADEGVRSVIIDLSQMGVQVEDEAWYFGLIMAISRRLRLKADVFTWWKTHEQLGFTQRLTQFLQEILLEEIAEPVVIFIDEIDSTLSLPFTDDFFAAIRYVHNARSTVPAFKRLSFVLIGVATPNDLIGDPRRTPFNVGRRIDLDYFTEDEAMPLAGGFDLPADEARQQLRDVVRWTGGHPYLTQRLCQVIAEQQHIGSTDVDVDRAVTATFLGQQSEHDSNLRFVHDMLTRRAADPSAVLATYQAILQGRRVPDDVQSAPITHLKLSGIVGRQNGRLEVRNPIYAAVFNRSWLKDQWPEHWIRRVPPAVLGLVAALFMSVVLLGLFVLQTQRAGQAERQSAVQEALNQQLSDQIQITDSLHAAAQAANVQLSNQVRISDSLRAGTEAINTQLAAEFAVSDALRLETEAVNAQLAAQFAVSDSLNTQLAAEVHVSDSLRSVAETRLDETQAARLETITIALASTATRQLRLGDAELGALLARQAYLFSREGEGEFLDPVYDALLQSLNALDADDDAGGPEVFAAEAQVRSVAYGPDGHWVAAGDDAGGVTLWPNGTGGERKQLKGHRAAVRSVAFSPDGTMLASAGDDLTVRIWSGLDAETPVPETIGRHESGVWTLAFSPDGSHLASAGADHTVVVRSMGADRDSVELDVRTRIRSLSFSPDGRLLAIGGENGRLQLWAWQEPEGRPTTWDAGQGILHGLVFSPDGTLLASGGDSLLVRLWRLKASDAVPDVARTLRGHEGPVHAVAFSSDGETLASGSADHSVQVWDVGRLDTRPILLQDHASWVWSLAFSPDGTRLASAGADRTIRLWNVKPGRLAEAVCTSVKGRELRPEEWTQFIGDDFPYERDYQPCSLTAADRGKPSRGTEEEEQ